MSQRTEVAGIYKEKEGILLNKDMLSLQAYKAQKRKNKKIDEVENDLAAVKEDLSEIKHMLRKFLSV
jgi:hypothetical protein